VNGACFRLPASDSRANVEKIAKRFNFQCLYATALAEIIP